MYVTGQEGSMDGWIFSIFNFNFNGFYVLCYMYFLLYIIQLFFHFHSLLKMVIQNQRSIYLAKPNPDLIQSNLVSLNEPVIVNINHSASLHQKTASARRMETVLVCE